jgi:hypothetical protein
MNKKCFALAIVFSLFVSCIALADRTLDRTEILQIFEKLTSQPRKTWISAGVIEATHEEYRAPQTTNPNEINDRIKEKTQEYQNKPDKRELTENLQQMKLDAIPFNVRYRLSNEYTMKSTVIVKFDGHRFYWEINVDSRTDSVKPGKGIEGNFMTDQFDLDWNTRRIFTWDGEKYTMYFLPGNHAIVDSTGSIPHAVNGPLTAGVIPWKYGYCTYGNLAAAESSAVEKYIDGKARVHLPLNNAAESSAVEKYTDGQTNIHLTLNNSDGSEMAFVLDPQKDYAVISCSIIEQGNNVVTYNQYANHRLISGNWVPTTILIEQHDAWTNKLLARDRWNFISISDNAPMLGSFNVEYETAALIEYRSPVTDKPAMYRYSGIANTDLLLAERLAFASTEDLQPQNCATVALKYAADRLGRDVTDQELAQLVNEPDNTTSLYPMKEFAQGLGLYCRAVKADIQTLKSLRGCEIILHIPRKNHFVVLEGIDAGNVWSIDLASNKFYYPIDINFFGMDCALLVSNQPIQLQGNFTEIDDGQLHNVIGGSGYDCTNLLQEDDEVNCDESPGSCGGTYEEIYERWGCEDAPSGSCSSSRMISSEECDCVEDPYDPEACDITGEWESDYMRACD